MSVDEQPLAADIGSTNMEISKKPNVEAVTDSAATVLMEESERSDLKQDLKTVDSEKEENRGVPTNTDGAESPSDFHDWFAALNAEDRSAAASFVDAEFWGAFWEYAAPSWSSSSKSLGTHLGTGTFHYGGTTIVRETDGLRALLLEAQDRPVYALALSHAFVLFLYPNKDLASPLDWKAMVPLQDFVARYDTWNEDCHNQTEVSNAKEKKAKANLTDIEENIDNAKSESTALRIGNVSDVLNKTVAILPAAVYHITNQKIKDPIVTLQPSVWKKHQQQGWEIAKNLCEMASTATKSEWILRLSNGSNGQLVPLSSLLIARFQWAISNAYQNRECRRHATAADDISLLTKEVYSHCQGVKDMMMVMEPSTFSTFLEPLVDVCFGSKISHSNAESESFDCAILTPLSWLVHYNLYRKKRAFEWSEIDQAVGAALQRSMNNDFIGENPPDIVDHPNENLKSSEEGTSAQNKKKKKKAKKRKGKKGLSMGSPSVNSRKTATVKVNDECEKNGKMPSTKQSLGDEAMKIESCDAMLSFASFSSAKEKIKTHETDVVPPEENQKRSSDFVAVLSSSQLPASTAAESNTNSNRPRRDSYSSVESENTDFSGFVPTFAGMENKKPPVSFAGHLGQVARSASKVDKANVAAESTENTSVVEAQTVLPPVNRSNSDDGDPWETVEIRGRASRKKERSHHGRHSHNSAATTMSHDSNSKRSKGPRTPVSRRKNLGNRKMVREILFSVIDSVEEQVKKKKQTPTKPIKTPLSPAKPSGNSWQNGPPGTKQLSVPLLRKDFASIVAGSSVPKKEVSNRTTAPEVVSQTKDVPPTTSVPAAKQTLPQVDETLSKYPKAQSMKTTDPHSPRKHSPFKGKGAADQNTAPTYQETVSASSAFRNFSHGIVAENRERASKDSSTSADTDEAPQKRDRQGFSKTETDGTPSPPLPTTLLAPENSNSATSSVASSLDAPYAGRLHHHHHHHHSVTVSDINDVGYHLLDVCDRLSRDMKLFMSRRALALNTRRMERGALLAALQDNVSSIWPGRCHVELYGSCATLLDLPASDLDVVVRGLDRNLEIVPPLSHSGSSASICANLSVEERSLGGESQQQMPQKSQLPMHHHVASPYMWHHVNAERVVRLAANLEKQPWAVRVNAIPTASVPVVKILADPSKLLGTPSGSEWVTQQHLAVAASGASHGHDSKSEPQQSLLQWRGSDVMNGLLSLDITFEGPEHGGIGSTEFSAMVVAEACAESRLQPDSTPFVQVLMVLKELLAQRKLNEPYSGGLSSYALMLLVLALVREREAIKEEIERVERHKRAMAEAEKKHSMPRDQTSTNSKGKPLSSNKLDSKSEVELNSCSVSGGKVRPASWANIAKKSSGTKSSENNESKVQSSGCTCSAREESKSLPARKPSFADAVSRTTSKAVISSKAPSHCAVESKSCYSSRPEVDLMNATDAYSQSNAKGSSLQDADKIIFSENEIQKPTLKDTTSISGIHSSSICVAPEHYPQGFNDIVEVLCSGETTAGKLLMHFLLFYGQHFDAQTTAIDISGKHERDTTGQISPYYISPYILRKAPGTIDPVTGMLTVDPIVIYDPLEGAENNNVARRCFAWNSVRWIFAQSYATLASAVERSATPPSTPGGKPALGTTVKDNSGRSLKSGDFNPDAMGDLMDPSSPLLRCLLSF